MTEEITSNAIFKFILIFSRIATFISILPAIGENYIYNTGKLVLALAISLLLFSNLENNLPDIPGDFSSLAIITTKEVLIGAFLGTLTQIVFSALNTGGSIISYQIGLSAGTVLDPSTQQQSSVISSFFTTLGIMLIFTSNLHHTFLHSIINSYKIFPVNYTLDPGMMLEAVSSKVNQVFSISIRFASPYIVTALLLYLGSGIIGRLVPQMQVFFIIMPLNILIGILIMSLTLSGVMMWYIDLYYNEIVNYFNP